MKMKKKMKIKKTQLKNKQLQLIGGEFIEDEEPKLSKIPAQILRRKNGFDYENPSEPLEKNQTKQKVRKRVERKI